MFEIIIGFSILDFLKAEHIISVSEFSKKDIIKTYEIAEKKVSAIYNGACERFSLVNLDEKNEIRIKYADGRPFLFVGSIHPRKNVERLLEAFRYIIKNTLNII